MIHLPNILASWSPEQWGQFLGYLSTFLTLALLPLLLKIFSAIRDLRNKTQATDVKAEVANTKAEAANQSIKNTNDRVVMVATQALPVTALPAAPPNPPTPSATGISAAMRAQEPPAQRPNIPK